MADHPRNAPPGQARTTRRRWLWLAGAGAAAVAGGVATQGYWKRWWQPKEEAALDVCIVSPPTPYDPASGKPMEAPREVPESARCPVCGMYPARDRIWAAQVLYRNGDAHFFDSPIDLFQFLDGVERFNPGHSRADILSMWVTDAASRNWTAAEQAWYVHGSDALGPMRMGDLPAFADKAQAQDFSRQRGGKVLSHAEVTPAIIKTMSVERNHALHEGMHDDH
ncbi:MAG: hypothetical protein GXY45_11095 [Ramlibacter sp.]|nr:hypothetical protein [Ramlibacter sp.]